MPGKRSSGTLNKNQCILEVCRQRLQQQDGYQHKQFTDPEKLEQNTQYLHIQQAF